MLKKKALVISLTVSILANLAVFACGSIFVYRKGGMAYIHAHLRGGGSLPQTGPDLAHLFANPFSKLSLNIAVNPHLSFSATVLQNFANGMNSSVSKQSIAALVGTRHLMC